MIYRKIPYYEFKSLKFCEIKDSEFLKKAFYILLPELPSFFEKEKMLFQIPGALSLRVIKRSYNSETDDIDSVKKEGCFYFNEENEWMLEAEMNMRVTEGNYTDSFIMRLPLSAPFAKNTKIGIYFDGTWIRFMKDGEILNENSGLDAFCEPNGEIFIDEALKGTAVSEVREAVLKYRDEAEDSDISVYYPYGWNTNIGDVMTYYHDGTYHVMYLADRRHHGSRNGQGAHSIQHMTTSNLKDWYEQKPIAAVDAPWQTYGTGTMIFHDGRYYMSYGFHTERYMGDNSKILPEYNEEEKSFESLSCDEILKKNALPMGASYSVSEDGINFAPSNSLFSDARNPSIYTNKKGGITLYGGYGIGVIICEAENMEAEFYKSAESFDFVEASVMRNTTECPAFFEWNGYKYLLIGFTGYYRTLKPDTEELTDVAALGEYIYDGLGVPMVSEYKDNRRIIAGWIKESPKIWGGAMVQRELVAEKDGRLGMKWIPELKPNLKNEAMDLDNIVLEKDKDYYFEMTVNPMNAKKFGLSFYDDENSCTLELDFNDKTLQINHAEKNKFGEKIPSAVEILRNSSESPEKSKAELNIPSNGYNYSLQDILGIEKPFSLKLAVRRSKRFRATVIDVEIAERRTLLSVRKDFFPDGISIIAEGDCEAEEMKVYSI